MAARQCSRIGVQLSLGALVWLGAGCDDTGTGAPRGLDIGDALAAIEGVAAVDEQALGGDYRRFTISFEQPVDHGDPDGPRFTQALTLLHRDREAPVVLVSTGYHDFLDGRLTEPARLLDANQIVVEHRYFGSSRPAPLDWAHLDIEQAAADHHRVIEALAPLYAGAWISTGISKGGTTSVFHRRFYPDDVVATVAYVAPISFAVGDDRYEAFFTTIGETIDDATGGTAGTDCRRRLHDLQRELLVRRDALEDRFADMAAARGYTFERFDGIGRALETAAVELEWTFWQYLGLGACDLVPGTGAGDDEIAVFVDIIGVLWTMSDQQIAQFEPYYHQAATQMGYPGIPREHIADLLEFDYLADFARLLPAGAGAAHDPAPMRDIADWLASEGERVILVYGAHDPWTGGAFDIGQARDSYSFIAPSTSHEAQLRDLPGEVHEQAADALYEWIQTQQHTTTVWSRPAAAPATLAELRVFLRERFPARPRLGL